jgi:hypothetical protein
MAIRKNWTMLAALCVTGAMLGGHLTDAPEASAADHAEAPGAAADSAADIADFYAWHTENDTLVMVVTFAPLTPAGGEATWDADVLYSFHIDTDGDNTPDFDVRTRFGQNDADEWGMLVEGLPGEDGPLVGPVATMAEGTNGAKAWAGITDDPFFFDLEGFETTLMTGALSFDPNRDSLAGVNVTSIVVEVPLSALGSTNLSLWATTGRK